jgi:hypothetical protein
MRNKSIACTRSIAVKETIHEQEYQDCFSIPLQYRIRAKSTPKKYQEFLKKNDTAIELIDSKPIPVRSRGQLPKIPSVSVSLKFIRHRENERTWSEILAKSKGEEIHNPKKVKERYFGSPEADLMGRKAFPNYFASLIN